MKFYNYIFKKNEEKAVEDNSPPVPENLAPANRIPPIPINDEDDLSAAPNSLNNNAARKNKKKVKKAKESIRERREFINQSIRFIFLFFCLTINKLVLLLIIRKFFFKVY